MIVAVLACTSDPAVGPPPPAQTTADTGTTSTPGTCPRTPCVRDLAAAVAVGQQPGSHFGSEISLRPAEGLVAVAGYATNGEEAIFRGEVGLFDADLRTRAQWPSIGEYDLAGSSLALGDRLAVGAPNVWDEDEAIGAVYLLDLDTTGILEGTAAARITGVGAGVDHPSLGRSVAWLDLDGDGADLVATASGAEGAEGGTAVLAFPGDLVGEQDATAAVRAVRSSAQLGGVVGWDADGDGIDDLVVRTGGLPGLARFPSPWTADRDVADADVTRWTDGDGVSTLAALGDLDGDGRDDLGLTTTSGDTRAMRVLTRDDLGGGSLDALPVLVSGSKLDGFGTALAAGDVDGDGHRDLVVGSYHHFRDGPGWILVFRGPLAIGPLVGATAIYGEEDEDGFGEAVAVGDLDHDGLDEIVVGAPYARKVYLLRGGDLP